MYNFHELHHLGKDDKAPKEVKSSTLKVPCYSLYRDVKISVYEGDICKEKTDAIVSSANEQLKHGVGLPRAIVKAGGKSIQDESDEIMKKQGSSSLQPGNVVVTSAGNLPCKFIVHAVGPRWNTYSTHQKDTAKSALYNAVLNSLRDASRRSAASISIPGIGSGLFCVPLQICAEVLFKAATNFAMTAPSTNTLKDIRFVNIDKKTTQAFAQEMKKRFGAAVRQENI